MATTTRPTRLAGVALAFRPSKRRQGQPTRFQNQVAPTQDETGVAMFTPRTRSALTEPQPLEDDDPLVVSEL